jgi:hypothetical protein
VTVGSLGHVGLAGYPAPGLGSWRIRTTPDSFEKFRKDGLHPFGKRLAEGGSRLVQWESAGDWKWACRSGVYNGELEGYEACRVITRGFNDTFIITECP